MIWKEFIKEIKDDIETYKSLGWRGILFILSLLWTCFWMMAIDSVSTEAFLLSIIFMLLGIVSAGICFISFLLEDLKDTKKIDRRTGQNNITRKQYHN